MTLKPSQTDLSIKSYDKNSARNGLPSAVAKLTLPLRDAFLTTRRSQGLVLNGSRELQFELIYRD